MPISPLRRAVAVAAVVAAGAIAGLHGSSASAQSGTVPLPRATVPAANTTCYPPTPGCDTGTGVSSGPTLNLSATTVTRGQTIGATAAGLGGNTPGIFSVASVEQQLAAFTTSAAGTASANITIPTNISLGAHTIFVRGRAANGTSVSASRAINVVAGTAGGGGGTGGGGTGLARTGAVVVPAALVGLALVAGGVALKRSSRRGKSSTSPV